MPLFRDPDRRSHYIWSPDRDNREHPTTGSPGSQPNEMGNGLLNDSETARAPVDSMELSPSELNLPKSWANDREQLIHHIKESSSWKQHTPTGRVDDDVFMPHLWQEQFQTPGANIDNMPNTEKLESPADIQRPRSALHSGDFREGHDPKSPQSLFGERSSSSPFAHLSSSPTTPWFGAPKFAPALQHISTLNDHGQSERARHARARAPSLGSFSSSYVLKAPTSPLVYQANNADSDYSPQIGPIDVVDPSERANRRRTLPPETFRNLQFYPPSNQMISPGSPSPTKRRQDSSSQIPPTSPRRSLTSAYSLQLAPSPAGQIPQSRARRPSFASEVSVKPHAPMVGSYEESILRGRMSMNPSKPLDFTAQIGVLGKGNCKGALKCPPHVTVPFPVVFYSYPTSGSGRSISDDNPSPYVGQIDLEHSLPKENLPPTRRRRRHTSPLEHRDGTPVEGSNPGRTSEVGTQRRREKKHRRSESPKRPPGGAYRIPQQGQLQIIIKNPHKTAVKLFLVPYDLSDMEPGTKTFIRQRSYSAGPIIDMPLSARKNFGTDRPEASLNPTEDPKDKPTLRYLIHLNICSPSRGRFYLHSSIRVVFANRVPDGKEKLRNEIQNPEPRYSPYKPSRETSIPAPGCPNPRSPMDLASRRRSVGQGPFFNLHSPVSSPVHLHSQLDDPTPMDLTDSTEHSHTRDLSFGHNLYHSDAHPASHHSTSGPGSSIPEPGESLLAKRLRGLDVHRQNSLDEQYPHNRGFHDRLSPHDPRLR
ncbi:unnamed protein product [Penicillium salamii]|uniref:Atos-like conserved domain-containing protein n=1 Tax=Penicillium salamii TaxID=1612424 RepID=A0A9W4JU38_9EURO|nr:unnamed protein product [Penicillium salamii]CAG8100573.1 unnamed protein product [Penicillium salamii]CAG8103068.1 unnamed protein product [Penicillium salamii]CAG8170123.1 unnamed protein product [Penicillium salamii]CAG8222470.1 unnamed protein product [Penicillium salamii]